jgi:hypothetical protein
MAYSKAYQTVWAGRVREDEAILFYGQNRIALPPRVTTFTNLLAAKQPTLKVDLANEFVGKSVVLGGVTSTKRNIGAYVPGKVQVS